MNVSGVNGIIPPGRSATAAKTTADTASFTRSDAVETELRNLPDSRPEAVARARQLISDANYPSSAMVKQLSQFLAANLKSEND